MITKQEFDFAAKTVVSNFAVALPKMISYKSYIQRAILDIATNRELEMAMEAAGKQKTLLDVHVAGLMAVVMDHLARCGRLIFGDLLIYMDCFSLLLEADGFSEKEIKEIYPRVTHTIVELYPDYIFNTTDLSPFKDGHFDFVLFNVSHK